MVKKINVEWEIVEANTQNLRTNIKIKFKSNEETEYRTADFNMPTSLFKDESFQEKIHKYLDKQYIEDPAIEANTLIGKKFKKIIRVK